MKIDLDELVALIELLKGVDYSEFKYEHGDLRVVIRRGSHSEDDTPAPVTARAAILPTSLPQGNDPDAAATTSQVAAVRPPAAPNGKAVDRAIRVTSPLLGTFYARPKPGQPPFVSVGNHVEPDTVLFIIEVMKLMNSVVAGVRGSICSINATEGQLVEHGQLLFTIAPLAK